jgi:membrane protein implicated in regulation of membrane protease activity
VFLLIVCNYCHVAQFSIVLIGVLPLLLGYYHLGRLGFLLSVAAGFAIVWSMAVCGILSFVWVGHYFGGVWLSTVLYAACVVMVYLLIARLHLRAARSTSLHDAQRKLRLIPSKTP